MQRREAVDRVVEARRVVPEEEARVGMGGEKLGARAADAGAALGGQRLEERIPGRRQPDERDALRGAGQHREPGGAGRRA
jgi:hypothetical protein